MSPALNGRSAIQHFEHSNVIEIHDGITFDFYTRLPQLLQLTCVQLLHAVPADKAISLQARTNSRVAVGY